MSEIKRNNQLYQEVTLETKPVYSGRVISLQLDTVRLPNGETSLREIVKHPGAVAVLAVVEDRMLMVEQYRKAPGRSLLEVPAGKLEPGEDPLEAAKRELEEETGYRAASLRQIAGFYTSPGFADEFIHLFAAAGLERGEAKPDEDEFLNGEAVTLEQAEAFIAEGRIADAKTIMAVYAWKLARLNGGFGA